MKPTSFLYRIPRTVRTVGFSLLLLTHTALYAAEIPAMTEEQKTLYAIGLSVSRSLAVFDLTAAEFASVTQGLTDAQTGKNISVDLAQYNAKIQELAKARRKASGEKQSGAGKIFLENAAKEKNAIKTASGMVYIPAGEGTGDAPKANDIVKVNYRGTLIDGKEFDSSFKRGNPLEFRLDNVIKCWVEGIQMMKPGGKATFVCPSHLAYGENGAGEFILPGATLKFYVELLEVTHEAAAVKPAVDAPAKAVVPAKK